MISRYLDLDVLGSDMEEYYALRVMAERAGDLFGPKEGHQMGHVRAVTLKSDDERIPMITALQRQLRLQGSYLVAGWSIIRKYTQDELLGAAWLHLLPTSFVLSAGEDCTTVYDETEACPVCSWGSRQITPLSLPKSKIPKGADLSWTWGDEYVVTDRARELIETLDPDSVDFGQVVRCNSKTVTIDGYWQMGPRYDRFRMVPPTVARDHVIDDGVDPDSARCPFGHTIGHELVTELYVASQTSDLNGHMYRTSNGVGSKQGLFRPRSEVLVSQEFYRRWVQAGLYGAKFEVAHVVDS